MFDVMKSLNRQILRMLPELPANYLIYFRGYRRLLNLKNPQYFGEKIQWLKLYGNLEELKDYVDKYEVRKFVEKTVGKQYLNTLYGVYDSVESIDIKKLPKQFVLKCTNGCGGVYICKDKNILTSQELNKLKDTMRMWLKDDFYKMKKEPQYKNIKNRIIAEQYLEDDSGALRDYKFYCYDGVPYYYAVFTDRYSDKKTEDIYDINGKKLKGVSNGGVKNSDIFISQPDNFNELVEIVKKLASPFQFVRVDFYMVNKKFYFGELTFTDGAGSDPFSPKEFDLEMAKRIKLGRVLIKP